MKFKSTTQFFSCHYQVSTPWKYLEETLKRYHDRESIQGCLGLDLNPDFQRGHVWSEDKQIAYVEFCLRGGDSSRTILFNHPNWQGNYVGMMTLVDGKQRIEAVRKFMRNELAVFDGHFIDDFEDKEIMLRSFHAEFIFKINNLKTRRELLEWYLQLNDGGVIHTREELDKVQKLLDVETA